MTAAANSGPVAPGASINEDVFYEGGPAKGDLITNLLFGLTLIGIPFAVGAIVRALWLRFTITSRRVSVSGGWLGRDRTQVVYKQIREVRSVARGLGFWGDMVLVLNDGMKLEMRAVPNYREAEAYIQERMAASTATKAPKAANSGFAA
ncbi:PH domain-containing protein [Synechococcus sp. HJ21-Hayes]|uniref:PH domain-containing protein n=1 Tax=unclassified Synechococcus TaxID=2626047 RepID=UPI0020CE0D2E|nr:MULTISPECIES: PH domain-containing protein [unclassified Synechococcus]MCP9831780.1 PH domain-containing protein [Synechococcus sp. JJ3a-Johnson]MCP9853785.1 PH domain-containing protein [Synechococcus sp. HJ21-Hayes]